MGSYYVYILECSDQTLYTGWTDDIEKRLHEHNGGRKGAKYTKSRRPVRVVHIERCADISDALRREARIKSLSRAGKLELIRQATGDPT